MRHHARRLVAVTVPTLLTLLVLPGLLLATPGVSSADEDDTTAAWETHRAELEDLLTTIRFDFGRHVDDRDLRRAAASLGIRFEGDVTAADVEDLLAAYRDRAALVLAAFGGGEDPAVPEGLGGVAERLGLPVGALLGPFDLQRMVAATEERAEERAAERQRTPRFAAVDALELRTVSHEAVLVGFHQSWDPGARQLDAVEDTAMMTLPSRGRGTSRRSAADISVPEGVEIVAPVSGEVVEVGHYALYGRYPDVLIRIVPDEHPDLVVSVLHVSEPTVQVGDAVVAGETPLAETATTFPFTSQIDRFAGRLPHVHLEVSSP